MRWRVLGLASLAIAACASDGAVKDPARRDAGWTWSAPHGSRVGIPGSHGDGDVGFVVGQHELVVLDGKGRVRWRSRYVGLRRVAPAFFQDHVVAAADDAVVGFDRRTGAKRWSVPTPARANAPVAAAGLAVATSTDGSTRAVDVTSGAVRWTAAPVPGQVLGVAAARGGAVAHTWEPRYPGQVSGVIVYDLDDGDERWRVELTPGPTGAPAIVGDEVVAVTADQRIEAFALDDGRPRWAVRTPGAGAPAAAPVGRANDVLVVDRLGVISAVRSGRVLWRHDTGGAIDLAPVAADRHTAVVVLAGGDVVSVTADDVSTVRVPDGTVGAAVQRGVHVTAAFETNHGSGVTRLVLPPRRADSDRASLRACCLGHHRR